MGIGGRRAATHVDTPVGSTDDAVARGDDITPVHVRLRRHAVGILTLTVGAAVMGAFGVFAPEVPWWLPSSSLVVVSVLIAVVYAARPGVGARDVHTRAAVHAFALTAVTYATGWGFALPFVHLFGIADNINESGARASRAALGWAVGTTTVAQLGAQAGLVPLAAIGVRSSHLVAGVTIVLLVLVTRRLRSAAAERERARVELARSERRFRTLVEDASDVILLLDRELVVSYASPAVSQVLGIDEASVVGTPYLDIVAPRDVDRVAASVTAFLGGTSTTPLVSFDVSHRDGTTVAVQASHRDLFEDADVAALVVSLRDVSERLRLEAQVQHGRSHDSVTGLPNRTWLEDRVDALMVAGASSTIGLLAVGVDGLEPIVEAAGHAETESIVRAIARDLGGTLRDGGVVARVAEHRFVVLSTGVGDIATLHTIAARLRSTVERDVDLGDIGARLVASVGIAPGDAADTGSDLLRAAELALRASTRSDSRIARFDESLRRQLVERLQAERELAVAIEQEELVVHYQPLVGLEAGPDVAPRLVGVEALVRWQHPVRGLVMPGQFIPLAEETGLVVDIGWWVLDRAVEQLVAWDQELGEGTIGYVSVNVSMLQFASGELVSRVQHALARVGLAPSRLLLELTETSLAEDESHAAPQLSMLAGLGVGLAIDDFGTGYSSMQYLQQFPVDVLKVDRAFVSRSGGGHQPELLESLRRLGTVLGLRTVAEGIETLEELEAVHELQFHVGQGYFFGRPAPPAQLSRAVRRRLDGDAPLAVADRVGPRSAPSFGDGTGAEAGQAARRLRD